MAKFAIYTYLFGKILVPKDQLLFNPYEGVDFDLYWDKKQSYVTDMFKTKEALEFKIGNNKTYDHQLISCVPNPNIIIMRIANNKEAILEHGFRDITHEWNPSCYVFIDNRKDIQRIAIQQTPKAFYDTKQVANIIQAVLNEKLKDKFLTFEIAPKKRVCEFWEVTTIHNNKIVCLDFDFNQENISELQDLSGLMKDIQQSAGNMNGYVPNYRIQAKSGMTLRVDKTYDQLMSMVSVSSALSRPINVRTIDDLSFDCYVDKRIEEKIVYEELDDRVLEMLSDSSGLYASQDMFNTGAEKVVEFMNKLKTIYD